MIHREPLLKHHEPLLKHHETLLKHCEILEHSPFDATILVLDAETSVFVAAASVFGMAISVPALSFRQYWRRVIGNCGVGITPQMCNRVTNHGDIGTFSRPSCTWYIVCTLVNVFKECLQPFLGALHVRCIIV